MTNGVSSLKTLGLCMAAGFALAAVSIGAAQAADGLQMAIENESTDTLYYETGVGVENAPETIAPNTTSSYIKGPHSGGGGDGQATYTNSQNPASATCSVTLGYGYEWNDVTDHCDKKKFNITEKGQCTLVKDGDCEGSGSCKCKFKFTAN
jgi:opacity protein-like surface antigen